jgi:pyrroline-5-carboxylate reductase
VIVVATKPAAVPGVLQELVIAPPQLVLSIAAGVTTATIAANVPIGTDIVRVMPNTPALVNEGMSVLSAHEGCSAAGLRVAQQLMSCVGKVAVVPESQQDAVTALSGSGPAYFFLVVEAMTDAGVELGLEPAIAAELAGQTAVGAAAMLRAGTADAPTLRANVTSPGGTTAAAVAELTGRGLPAAILAAMRAARDRSAELGK